MFIVIWCPIHGSVIQCVLCAASRYEIALHSLHRHRSGANFDQQPWYVGISATDGLTHLCTVVWTNTFPCTPVRSKGTAPSSSTSWSAWSCNTVRKAIPQDLQAQTMHSKFCHVGNAKLNVLANSGHVQADHPQTGKGCECDHCLIANSRLCLYCYNDNTCPAPCSTIINL